jgi:hypothetical protein
LYDFASETGEKWLYRYSNNDTVVATVFGRGTDARLGVFIDLEFKQRNLPSYRDTIYERLLGGYNYIIPWDVMASYLDGQEGGPLRCFTDSKVSYVSDLWEEKKLPCKFLSKRLGVETIEKTNMYAIYPNPSKGVFQINDNKKPAKMEVYSTHCELLFSSETTFQTPQLSPQLYTVKLWRNDGLVEVHWVVVE